MRNIEKWRSQLIVDLGMSKSDDDFMAICPCHKDNRSSLHVYVGKKTGEIVMKCFVCGATERNVCERLGFPLNWLECDEVPSFHRTADKPPITVDWNWALDVSACAVMDKIAEVAGDCQVASDQLIDSLVGAFSDRLGSIVSEKITRAISESTPPADKTVRADGFEEEV
ncbi:MAG: hypothetical protein IKU38_08855 [Clostridia bacterium]|nr:hypothetical protein [Clostridia bacterium]